MNYGRAVKIARNASGLSQVDLARRLTVGASHLSLIEAGKRQPSLQVLQEIAEGTGVPVHLITLLASEAIDLERPDQTGEIGALAIALLRVLVSGTKQPSLPLLLEDESRS